MKLSEFKKLAKGDIVSHDGESFIVMIWSCDGFVVAQATEVCDPNDWNDRFNQTLRNIHGLEIGKEIYEKRDPGYRRTVIDVNPHDMMAIALKVCTITSADYRSWRVRRMAAAQRKRTK